VKSPVIGRDLNPMGRGDGYYYMCGDYYIAAAKPFFVGQNARGYGSSINNSPDTPHELANDPCAQEIIEKAQGQNQMTIQETCEECWPKVPSWHPAWPCEFAKLLCCLFTHHIDKNKFDLSSDCDYKSCTAGYPWRACCYVCGHCIGQSEEEQASCPCDNCGIYCAPCKCPPVDIHVPCDTHPTSSRGPVMYPRTGNIRAGTLHFCRLQPAFLSGSAAEKPDSISLGWGSCDSPPGSCPAGYIAVRVFQIPFTNSCLWRCLRYPIPEGACEGDRILCDYLELVEWHLAPFESIGTGGAFGCIEKIEHKYCAGGKRLGPTLQQFYDEVNECCLSAQQAALLQKALEIALKSLIRI